MKKTLILGAAALSLAAAVGAAAAQAPAQRHSRDADNDGRISQAEFVNSRIARLTVLDANRDGTVTAEEFRAGRQAQRAERQSARFERLDADRDGSISRAEFTSRPAREDGARAEHAGRRDRGHRHGGFGRHRGMEGARGPVVISEVTARLAEGFAKADADRDGYLSQAERRVAMAAQREQRQERRAERRAQRQAQQPASPSAAPSE